MYIYVYVYRVFILFGIVKTVPADLQRGEIHFDWLLSKYDLSDWTAAEFRFLGVTAELFTTLAEI